MNEQIVCAECGGIGDEHQDWCEEAIDTLLLEELGDA